MSVAEGKIGPLRMSVCGNIPPGASVLPDCDRWHSESRIEDLIFVNIDKHEQFARIRVVDLSELAEAGNIRPDVRRTQLRRAVDREAHVVTAPAKLRELVAGRGHNRRAVGGTMIDGKGCVVWKKQPILNPIGFDIEWRVVRAPGSTACERAARA